MPSFPYQDVNGEEQRVLMDSGATASFISEKTVDNLGLERKVTMKQTIEKFGGGSDVVYTSLVIFPLHLPSGKIIKVPLWTHKTIATVEAFPYELKELWPQFEGKLAETFPRMDPQPVDILLGVDVLPLIEADVPKQRSEEGLAAIATVFGWVPYGVVQRQDSLLPQLFASPTKLLEQSLQQFWAIEELPGDDHHRLDQISTKTIDELAAEELISTNLRFFNGQYHSEHLIRPDAIVYDNNSNTCVARFMAYEKFLATDDLKRSMFHEAMAELAQRGDIEKVGAWEKVRRADADPATPTLPADVLDKGFPDVLTRGHFYVPVTAVFDLQRLTTKVRLCYDLSQKNKEGISLNSLILQGPKMHNDIVALLLKFRRHPFVILGDISKMFFAVAIGWTRDWMRFVYRTDPNDPLEVWRFCSLVMGATDSPFQAMWIVMYHGLHVLNTVEALRASAQSLIDDSYVDDYASALRTVTAAIRRRLEIQAILASAGLKIQKWRSNSKEVLQSVPDELTAPTTDEGISQDCKILGVKWKCTEDVFHFQGYSKFLDTALHTKMGITQTLPRFYDPLGLLSPFLLVPKILIQDAWCAKLGWHDPLPDKMSNQWQKWKDSVPPIEHYQLPRFNGLPEFFTDTEVHVFADASKRAMGVVAYAVTNQESVFLLSRSKLAPIGGDTIPKLELSALLRAAKTASFLQKTFDLRTDQIHLWSDNATCVYWCSKDPGNLIPYVGNRVREIQRFGFAVHHVPGEDNPADMITRGASIQDLQDSFWLTGPTFLITGQWPPQPDLDLVSSTSEAISAFRKQRQLKICYAKLFFQLQEDVPQPLYNKFQQLQKCFRVTAYVLRFAQNLLQRLADNRSFVDIPPFPTSKGVVVSVPQMQTAELFWVIFVQNQHFQEDLACLQHSSRVEKSSKLANLAPFFDVKLRVIRVGGRLQFSDTFGSTESQPIILPAKDDFVRKFILHYHQQFGHAGPEWLLCYIRKKYWILQGRRTIQAALKHCPNCIRFDRPVVQQQMAPLPPERLRFSHPFSHVGMDFAGPFHCHYSYEEKSEKNKRTIRKTVKIPIKLWVLIAVCYSTRAVHLEVCERTIRTETFIQALRRMCHRRGMVEYIFSDQAQTFHRGNKELQALLNFLNCERTHEALSQLGLTWEFNSPLSPFKGGLYERFCGSLKRSLKRTLYKANLDVPNFYTTLTMIEAQINARPLRLVTGDKDDFLPISPAHLCIGRDLFPLPGMHPTTFDPPMDDSVAALWERRRSLSNSLWKRFKEDYLSELTTLTKWHMRHRNLQIGDVVLLADKSSRADWPIGRIVGIKLGRDDLVRTVTVQTPQGTFVRPLSHIVLLEETLSEDPRGQ